MIGEVPRVPDAEKYPERLRRFTEIVSQILNSLEEGGYIVRGADGTYSINGGLDVLTTKGDLLGYSTEPARVPVGTNGSILTADSTDPLGVTWSSVAAGADPISSIYPPFTVTGNDDEFDNGSFTGWTAVNSGSHAVTVTEANNVASLNHPGGDVGAELHAWMKTPTITTGSYIEVAFRSMGIVQNFDQCGLIFANGTTYGAGAQAVFFESSADKVWATAAWTNYSTQGSTTTASYAFGAAHSDMFLRLVYSAANTFQGWASPDGVSWIQVVPDKAITLTPTKAGFFVSTAGGANPCVFSLRYCKFR